MSAVMLLFSVLLAATVGFAAHRASVCTVKAVAEIMTTGHAHMLISFGKTAVWVLALSAPLVWLVPGLAPLPGAVPTALSLAAGGLFGIGAAINGGCSISTITRFGGGDVGMGLTLAGLLAGMAPWALFLPDWRPPPQPSPLIGAPPLAVALAALAGLWAVWELVTLWRGRTRGQSLRAHLLAHRWRLSTAAAVMGVTNAILCALHGGWAYTGMFWSALTWTAGDAARPAAILVALFLALIGGATASAVARGRFRLRWRPDKQWLNHFTGGMLMGTGIALIPGGNAALLLHAGPSLSLHAIPAFTAMIIGIAGVLAVRRWRDGRMPTVDCSGDVCHTS